ncbi:MAG: InlB B-repeat-containing protein [Bacteroidota bacterium]
MKRSKPVSYRLLIFLLFAGTAFSAFSRSLPEASDSLVIQENTLGICTFDGIVETSAAGYTGTGYINADAGVGTGISWSFTVPESGNYKMFWRYALGGSDVTSRDGALYVNSVIEDTVLFPHSGSSLWSVWIFTDTVELYLETGMNTIRLSAITAKGLANIDYMQIMGSNLEMADCMPSYTFGVAANDPAMGSVTWSPKQELYDLGTKITVNASAKTGYFFHSWSGEEASVAASFSFNITQNTNLTALFYPNGTVADPDASGYASVQHDNGTPYLLIGGSYGPVVEPQTIEELRGYLESDEALSIQLSRHFTGTGEIAVHSNKTLTGTNDSAHIEGITLSVANCRNVIIKNITFSKVITYDEMEINGAKNILLHRCEFFTDLDHDKDYYDGLLDIKNASSFITVSWCNFHDHFKSILISSGDDSFQDSVQRITFHHNYFHDCGSRMPSIRFGKAHLFSNYYENIDDGIHTRLGACVKVEHNYFRNVDGALDQSGGYADMDPALNIFDNSPYATVPGCTLPVPYPYTDLVDSARVLPDLIPPSVRVFVPAVPEDTSSTSLSLTGALQDFTLYPTPCTGRLHLTFRLKEPQTVNLSLYSIQGALLAAPSGVYSGSSGRNEHELDVSCLEPGVYILRLAVRDGIYTRRMVKE